jgi:predicted cobalt transporter CbtA
MIHILYLIGFALLVAAAFAAFHTANSTRERILYGLKIFAQFVLVSLALAWVFYFIP